MKASFRKATLFVALVLVTSLFATFAASDAAACRRSFPPGQSYGVLNYQPNTSPAPYIPHGWRVRVPKKAPPVSYPFFGPTRAYHGSHHSPYGSFRSYYPGYRK